MKRENVSKTIGQWNACLDPSDRHHKYCRMSISPFIFYRESDHLFWRDFADDKRLTRFGNHKTRAWLHGRQLRWQAPGGAAPPPHSPPHQLMAEVISSIPQPDRVRGDLWPEISRFAELAAPLWQSRPIFRGDAGRHLGRLSYRANRHGGCQPGGGVWWWL